MNRVWRGLTTSSAETDPAAADPRLRGRTYAIPFERVWQGAVDLADGGLPRWTLIRADDEEGVIEAECRSLVFRVVDDVRVEIGLDENGQTRVDLQAASRNERADLGRNCRRIGGFVRRLDACLGASPSQILDATRRPEWNS